MRFILKQLKRIALAAGAFLLSAPVSLAMTVARFQRMLDAGVPCGPSGRGLPGEGVDMDRVLERLGEIPFEPVKPAVPGFAVGVLSNSYVALLGMNREWSGRFYPYPEDFEPVVISSLDGTPIAGVVGVHDDGRARPGLLICHGYGGSKNDHYILRLALTAYAGWGFNVMTIDLRDHGRSQRLSFSPTTFGWREGEDLLAAAKHLGERPGVTTVGITGFSLGACSTMRAAYMAREHPYLTGGAIAYNGATDLEFMIRYLDHKPRAVEPYIVNYFMFRANHYMKRANLKRYVEDPGTRAFLEGPFGGYGFASYLEEVSARHYGFTMEELVANASSKNYLAGCEVPLLAVHSQDDPVIPISEMNALHEISMDNPNVRVHILPSGHHCVYQYLDWNWFESFTRCFFESFARWE